MPPRRRSAATAPRAASGSAARSGAAGSGGRSAPSLPAALLSGYKRLPEITAVLAAPSSSPSPADPAAGSAERPASPPGGPRPTAAALAAAARRRQQNERGGAAQNIRLPAAAAAGVVAAAPFHALARRLAEGAAALAAAADSAPAGPSGGAGPGGAASSASAAAAAAAATSTPSLRTTINLDMFDAQLDAFNRTVLDYEGQLRRMSARGDVQVPVLPPGLAAEVAAAREACAEEFARALAESGVVEHAARALLLLQAQARAVRGGLLAYGTPLPPPGRGASLALALRTGRAAAGSIVGPMPGRTAVCALEGFEPPQRPATPLPPPMAYAVLVEALECARQLLSTSGPSSPPLAEQRREWWWLAGWAVCGAACPVAPKWLRRLWAQVTEPLLAVWPDGRLDLDALPPSAPPEVAAALAGGQLPQLSRFLNTVALAGNTSLGTATATNLFAACCEGGGGSGAQGATGFTLFLAPLLAYGGVGECQALLQSLGELAGLGAPSPDRGMCGGVRKDGAEKAAAARQAAALLRDLGRALRGRGGTGQVAGAGSDPASASSAAPESPAQRLGRMAAHASGLWGLLLGA
ncbi:hypothetical protein HYH03_015265 [Edaphochlamys debaryana]|uniref:Uncharacterized protein n=1 Tax=Edaphochlamys debaryana TaxID=47281 RepID=A0A835XM63_9CHLO|nr:hypothetical protein HYH03_015265 [Edaphochlamys debaryana]|eukprot:KAG2486059.1 hypothetical protein HYH03_015265 [Edaphochlamys debaryana]